jgi:hypothetical protein
MDEWVSSTLAHVFYATVDPASQTDSHGHPLRLLPDLSSELIIAGEPLRLTMAHLDQIIMEAASTYSRHKTALEYLYRCWKRALRMAKHVRTTAKKNALDEIIRLSHANCLFACTMPELFGRADQDPLVPLLLGEIDKEDDAARNERMLFDFVDAAVRKFNEDPDIYPAVFAEAMVVVSERLSALSTLDDVQPYMRVSDLDVAPPTPSQPASANSPS